MPGHLLPKRPIRADEFHLWRMVWLNRDLLLASAVGFVLWHIPIVKWVFYPVRLFVVFAHEASHCLAALLTGGGVAKFTLNPLHAEYRGLAYTYGGVRFIVTSAGYLGSVACGAILLWASSNPAWVWGAVVGMIVFVLGFTVIYGRSWFTVGFGVVFSGLLAAALYGSPTNYLALGLQFLAIQCCFGAFEELLGVIHLSRQKEAHSDAQIMRELTGVPALVWAVIWAGIGLAVLGFALRYTLRYS